MYCPECGTELAENQKFCSECGARIPIRHSEPKTDGVISKSVSSQNSDEFVAYVNDQIRKYTTFTSIESLIEGAKPLRFKWISILAISGLGLLIGSIPGLVIGCLGSFLVFRVILLLLLAKRTQRKYPNGRRSIDIDDLAIFLEDNLSQFGFTSWQRGNPALFGIRDTDQLIIECLFRQKTYHHIVFDIRDMRNYRIETVRATAKERLKDGGDRNPNLLYKADCIARPILEASIQFYLRFKFR